MAKKDRHSSVAVIEGESREGAGPSWMWSMRIYILMWKRGLGRELMNLSCAARVRKSIMKREIKGEIEGSKSMGRYGRTKSSERVDEEQ